MVLPAHGATVGRRAVRSWPGDTIRYYETIPEQWQWSLDNALDHWNETGADIRFVEVSSAAKAQLLIRYGPTYGAAGIGTLGYAGPSHKNIVHLATSYKRVDEKDPEQRAWVARLFAHELGHNLGYSHVSKPKCALMQPVFVFGACGPLAEEPGYYLCRYIDSPLLERHVARYGGRAEQPPPACLLEALPPALRDPRSEGGGVDTDSVVTLRWSTAGQPTGGRVLVEAWPDDDCGTPPRGVRDHLVASSKGVWVDDRPAIGRWCYRLTPTNRFHGEGPPSDTMTVDRDRPLPPAPEVGAITLAPSDFGPSWTFDVRLSADTSLVVLRDAERPELCPERSDSEPGEPVFLDGGRGEVYAVAARECLVFVAVSEDGRASLPVIREVQAPRPPTPVIIAVTRVNGGYAYEVTASAEGYYLEGAIVAGSCPDDLSETFTSGLLESEATELYPEVEGESCLVVAAMDEWGATGPLATRPLTVVFDE